MIPLSSSASASDSDSQTILAIDPGYDRVGWAVGTKENKTVKVLEYGIIQTSSKKLIGQRYQDIIKELEIICSKFKPKTLAIEKLYFSKNTTTALRVSEAKGIIIGTCLPFVSSIFEYDPSTIKLCVTGNGAANKQAVEKMVRMQLHVEATPQVDDTIDALAILLTHYVSHSPLQEKKNNAIL